MAERGVVIEFDFAVADGAEVLFETAKGFMKKLDGIKLDAIQEARFLSGRTYLEGFTQLFASVKTKKTPQKAAREFPPVFAKAMSEAAPAAMGAAFKNFLKALAERNVKAVILSRVPEDVLRPLFGFLPDGAVSFWRETSDLYGAPQWDSWRRASRSAGLGSASVLALTGSGVGVKAALRTGIGSVAVQRERTAWQGFVGANDVLPELSGKTAKRILELLHV